PDIKSCVLVVGGICVPAVQNVLKRLVGENKIAQNLNGDEAAVLGAGFRGAGLIHQFKVKEINVTDINEDADHEHHAFSTDEQCSELLKRLSETLEWLYGEGENALIDEFHSCLDSL
ncbi:4932_t:CDS:2, partial [Entrophospora sp. SA101]